MKFTKRTAFTLLLSIVFFTSCSKDTTEPTTATLEIKVLDFGGSVVAGATVQLHKRETPGGMISGPLVATQTTDANGVASFFDLPLVEYFWRSDKGCLREGAHFTTTGGPLKPNIVNKGGSFLIETGILQLVNNSSQTWSVTGVQSGLIIGLPPNTYQIFYYQALTDPYIIHAESNSTPPVIKDTTITFTCGETVTLNYPF